QVPSAVRGRSRRQPLWDSILPVAVGSRRPAEDGGLPKTETCLKVAAVRRVAETTFRRWRERPAKALWPRRFQACRDIRACGIRARICGRREVGELARPATPAAGVRCPPR